MRLKEKLLIKFNNIIMSGFVVVKDVTNNNKVVRNAYIHDDGNLDVQKSHLKIGNVYSINVFRKGHHVKGGRKIISLGRQNTLIDLNKLEHGKTYKFKV